MRKLTISLSITAALAFAALLAPGVASAAGCPPGQTGTPPYCVTPPPPTPVPVPVPVPVPPEPVSVSKIVHSDGGIVKLTLTFTKPGTLHVSGKAIKGLTITVNAAGEVTITLKLNNSPATQHFSKQGWTRPKRVTISFTATDGTVITKNLGIVFKKPGQ